ncbi:NifB/NifX family molybdenum-iron cluster-binding protein [Celerinatantimonas sp. YJH-8]|uniref:NifB/NifX family molybdenum-iron cluster-binding protein n=1 Tax=Celerinatantimonas sp. YJH-8 TaxID=3228714 RepID=UPI0038C4CB2D
METIQVCRELQVAGTERELVRVAFASSDQHQVDQHFASTRRFAIYGLEPDHFQLLKIVELSEPPLGHHQQNIETRLDLLGDCLAVYTVAVGDAVVRQLWARGIRPVRVPEGTQIVRLLDELNQELSRQSSALRRQMKRNHRKTGHLPQ